MYLSELSEGHTNPFLKKFHFKRINGILKEIVKKDSICKEERKYLGLSKNEVRSLGRAHRSEWHSISE